MGEGNDPAIRKANGIPRLYDGRGYYFVESTVAQVYDTTTGRADYFYPMSISLFYRVTGDFWTTSGAQARLFKLPDDDTLEILL